MLRMCVYMHSRFVENHLIRILEDGPLISEVVLSHLSMCIKLKLDVSTFRLTVVSDPSEDMEKTRFLQ
jgi:hypothetical protein